MPTDGVPRYFIMVNMHRRVLTSLVVVVLTLSCAWTEAKQSAQLHRGAVYLWSDQSYIASDSLGLTSRAWYEVRAFFYLAHATLEDTVVCLRSSTITK